MVHPIAPDYGQQFLFPPALEDFVPADHPARFLREFVDQLNLAELGFKVSSAQEGRPPYAPSLHLKIWLYGYLHGIRSTRKLEVACREHLSLLWLTGLIAPDHNSLWRFWNENKQALRAVFKQTVAVAMRSGCVGMVLQALDGTKIQAAASSQQGWSKAQMEKVLAQLEAQLDQTELKVVEENAQAAKGEYRLPAGLAERKALREEIKAGLAQLAADGRKHYHPKEPEARRMKVGQNNRYAYNAQAVADSQEGVIVACEVVRQETDVQQLVPMMEQAGDNLGALRLKTVVTVADSGYGTGEDLQEAQQKAWSVLAPPQAGKPAKGNPYASKHFFYDAGKQTVSCPLGQALDYEGQRTKKGLVVERYRCHCRECPVRSGCTKSSKGRQIEIWPFTPEVQAMRQRLNSPGGWQLWKQRREIIERCFGQIKQHDGFRRWTVWGLEAVRTQWAMVCAALNLRVLYRKWLGSRKPGTTAAALRMRPEGQIGWGSWVGLALCPGNQNCAVKLLGAP